MANDRNRTDEPSTGPSGGRQSESGEERMRDGSEDDVRGVADEEDEEFEDMDDLEEDDDSEGSF